MTGAASTDAQAAPTGAGLPGSTVVERRQWWRVLMTSPSFVLGAAVLSAWITCALLGELFQPYDPLAQDLLATNLEPSGEHLFGTDSLGRDILSRVIAGSRQVLLVAPSAAALGVAVGTVIGLVQGYYRGLVDLIGSRVIDAFLALPLVIVAFIFIVAVGPSIITLIMVIAFTFALVSSRTVRAAVLQERELDYVASARLRGEGDVYIMLVEILPNVMGVVVVEVTVRLGKAVFAVSVLSFLGFGVRLPTPDWGADIAANYQYLAAGFWWQTLFSAIAIASLITAVNLIGDAIESVTSE